MPKNINEFIAAQTHDRQKILSDIHSIIMEYDKTVVPGIELMMRSEMIVYKASGTFKYGLSSVNKYMSLHVLPMYGSATIYEKYKDLLKDAIFQKGCINFKNEDEMPLKVVKDLIEDCSSIDLNKIRQKYLEEKKFKKSKSKS